MAENLSVYLKFAERVAKEAGDYTLQYFQKGVEAEFKSDDTPVTVADRGAEKLIRDRIAEEFPDHAVVGEEYGDDGSTGKSHRWIIDPIDGTKSFVHGVPLYAVLIALEIDGKVEVGVAHFPALKETVSGANGVGAFWNGNRTWVSDCARLDRAVCCHIDTASFAKVSPERGAAWERLQNAVYYNAGWCDAYGYLLVATGRAEVMLDPVMAVWDCGPFPPIFAEAGGYFGDWEGNEVIDAGEAMATTKALLPSVLAELGVQSSD